MRRLPWKVVALGGLITALLFSAGKWAVGLYLARSAVPTAFGAAASFAALLLWLYYTAQIFLLGAEFTQTESRCRKCVEKRTSDPPRSPSP